MGEKIRVILVDDEEETRGYIRDMLLEYPEILVAGEADRVGSALSLLDASPADVLFTDIQMDGGSGFELAEAVHRRYPQVLVVFLTGHADFALDGYSYGPVDFLLKPVGRERLARTLARVRERLALLSGAGKSRPIRIGMQTDGGYKVLDTSEIAYLEKDSHSVRIIGKDGSALHTTGRSMQELETILAEYGFFRCHQSYIIPLRDIQSVDRETFGRSYKIRLRGSDKEFPLSRRKYQDLKEALLENSLPQI